MARGPAGTVAFRKYLSTQTLTDYDFSLGMVRDRPRTTIPGPNQASSASGSYTIQDFFVEKPGLMYKRGGTSFQSNTLNDHSDVDVVAIAAPNFASHPTVLAITSDGSTGRWLYDITGTSHVNTGTVVGFQPIENMTALIANRLCLTSGTLSPPVAPKVITNPSGTLVVAAWGGSPPAAIYSCVHTGRLLLANTAANPNRIYISPTQATGVETAWNTTTGFMDIDEPITGLASVNGVLLVFTRRKVVRILGDIPPGVTDANWTLQPGGNVGCVDARSIVKMNNEVYFANETGVYKTANGSGFDNLTNKDDGLGISTLWQSTLAGFSPGLGAVVSAGTYQNQYLLLSVLHNSGTRTSFLYYTVGQAWTLLSSKVSATMYTTGMAPTEGSDTPVYELYFGPADTSLWTPPRAQKMSGMWLPASGNKNDAGGTAVVPVWETRPFSPSMGLNRYTFSHLTYDMRDAASDNPTLAAQVATGIQADSGYGNLAESPLAETTASLRKRLTPYKNSQALSFKFTQSNASSKTEIYRLDVEAAPYLVADGQ